jgi:hypothetical protein
MLGSLADTGGAIDRRPGNAQTVEHNEKGVILDGVTLLERDDDLDEDLGEHHNMDELGEN